MLIIYIIHFRSHNFLKNPKFPKIADFPERELFFNVLKKIKKNKNLKKMKK